MRDTNSSDLSRQLNLPSRAMHHPSTTISSLHSHNSGRSSLHLSSKAIIILNIRHSSNSSNLLRGSMQAEAKEVEIEAETTDRASRSVESLRWAKRRRSQTAQCSEVLQSFLVHLFIYLSIAELSGLLSHHNFPGYRGSGLSRNWYLATSIPANGVVALRDVCI